MKFGAFPQRMFKRVPLGSSVLSESRRDQEEGGELDSHEEASPEEIKNRETVLGLRESWTSIASDVSQRRSYGHCLCDCSA